MKLILSQIYIYKILPYYRHRWYTQCVDFGFVYKSLQTTFLLYQIFVASIIFFIPLIVILSTYSKNNSQDTTHYFEYFSSIYTQLVYFVRLCQNQIGIVSMKNTAKFQVLLNLKLVLLKRLVS